jgi:NTP pyrophosphatase (non-canonical NTP hydrolase)|tara:strand:+ start:1142 stop:1909 length:768 start_codon:yes stop_codon:yes gene_type:complete
MFYIYHIPGIKIGCTSDLQERVIKQQGYDNYEILYKTNNINKASSKELELQTKYEYKQDTKPYKDIIMNIKNKFYITEKTITLNNTFDKELTGFEFPDYITYDDKKIYFTKRLITWITNNNVKSQNDNKRYIYRSPLEKVAETVETTIFDNIREWAKNKGILDKGDSKTQYIKFQEEAGELAKALLKNDKPEVIDAIGDIVVVLTNLAELEGLRIEDCIKSAYEVINKRTGKMINGTFVKDIPGFEGTLEKLNNL